MLIHDPHGDVRRQVRIDENHVAEVEARSFRDSLHAVESEVHLSCRIIGNLTGGGIAARHAGYEKPVASQHTGRRWFVRLVARG